MSKHTPGPWVVTPHPQTHVDVFGVGVIMDDKEMQYALSHTMCYQNAEANARLIAAAPTGLDAAIFVYERLLSHPVDSWRIGANGQQSLCVLRDFIADATGQTDQEVQEFYEAKVTGAA